MEEDKRSEELKEAIARYIGFQMGEPKERKPLTEEELRKGRELTEKMRSLSKEERLKLFKGDPDDDWSDTVQDK